MAELDRDRKTPWMTWPLAKSPENHLSIYLKVKEVASSGVGAAGKHGPQRVWRGEGKVGRLLAQDWLRPQPGAASSQAVSGLVPLGFSEEPERGVTGLLTANTHLK